MLNRLKAILLFTLFCSILTLNTSALSYTRLEPLPNTVTLTFDDGPNPRDTPRILDILAHYHIHAVFFVTARLARIYPGLVRRIADEGHVVASHTITHPRLTRLSQQRLKHEIDGSKQIIKRILGYNPICLRPPFLATSNRVKQTINNYGMYQVMGVGTSDYRRMGSGRLARRVLGVVHPGMILIFHDGPAKRAQTVRALPSIIEGILRKGYKFSLICQR